VDSLRSGELLRSYFRVRIDLRAAFGSIVSTLSSLKVERIGARKYKRIRQNFRPNLDQTFYYGLSINRYPFSNRRKIYVKYMTDCVGTNVLLLINWFIFLILHLFYFNFTCAIRHKVVVNLQSCTMREVTYPSQQDQERAALEKEDGVLVVSLFVTLIMESPLARSLWVRSTNEAALLSFTTGLAAGRARVTKLGKYSIRIQYTIKMNILEITYSNLIIR